MRLALGRRLRAAFVQLDLDGLHGAAEILFRPGPARRMDSRRAVERIDHQAGIVGEGGQAGRKRCGLGLDARVVAKAHAGLVRFLQVEFTRRYGVDTVRRKQFAHLGELAGIMRRDHETPGDAAMLVHITAIFCKSTSLPMPLRASANSAAN